MNAVASPRDIANLLRDSRATLVADGERLDMSEVLKRAMSFGHSLLDSGV